MAIKSLKAAIEQESPLQVVGTINAYSAMQADQCGFNAIYLSGAGVANASYGLPDLGMTNLTDVLEDVRRITAVTELPLLVDIDTGWGHAFNIQKTVKEMIRGGASAIHIEDQVLAKRCGHRPNKAIVSQQEMVDRVKAAVDAKTDSNFTIMARTDAFAVEGMQSAIDRAVACVEAGADIVIIGVSRCGKTPTSLYLAMQFGLKVANYPLTEDDDTFKELPKALLPYKDKIFGITISAERLHNIRQERRPNSPYASLRQCQKEIAHVETLFNNLNIPFINSTHHSIEEMATRILAKRGFERKVI